MVEEVTIVKLNNSVTATGNYNSVPTSLTSNVSVVNMIDGLTLTKDADKKNWANGDLTYIIIIDNQTDTAYENPIVTDIIDHTLVKFVPNSVTINGMQADTSKYNYNEDTHTLTVNLEDIEPSSTTTLTFRVEKNS